MVSVKAAAGWTGVAAAPSTVSVGLGWTACVGARVGCTTGKLVGRPVGGMGAVRPGVAGHPLFWHAAARNTSQIQDTARLKRRSVTIMSLSSPLLQGLCSRSVVKPAVHSPGNGFLLQQAYITFVSRCSPGKTATLRRCASSMAWTHSGERALPSADRPRSDR